MWGGGGAGGPEHLPLDLGPSDPGNTSYARHRPGGEGEGSQLIPLNRLLH